MSETATTPTGITTTPSSQGSPFKELLCAVDGSEESLAAIEQAASVAAPGAMITLLLVTSFRFLGDHRGPAVSPSDAERLLKRAVDVARRAGVECRVEVDPASPPANVILEWAADYDLLAIGAPATTWFGGMFLGGVAAGAERDFSTPLLIAHAMPARTARPRVLIASDGGEGSDELVALAAQIARAQHAEATLVHAIGPETGFHPHRIEHQARVLEDALGGDSEVLTEPASARSLVVETARALDASLVVMSSRRLGGVHAVGSVSRRMVHQGHCPVLLVAPETLLAQRAGGERDARGGAA